MKKMFYTIAILLLPSLNFSPMFEYGEGDDLQEPEKGKVIMLCEEMGDTIDLKERNYYRLFQNTTNFQHAVILKLEEEDLRRDHLAKDIRYFIQVSQKKE